MAGSATEAWDQIKAFLLCHTEDDTKACGKPAVASFTAGVDTYWLCAGHWDVHCRFQKAALEWEQNYNLDATE